MFVYKLVGFVGVCMWPVGMTDTHRELGLEGRSRGELQAMSLTAVGCTAVMSISIDIILKHLPTCIHYTCHLLQ